MRTKSWFFSAILLILIGTAGVVAFDFKLSEDTPAYSKTWTIEQGDLEQLLYDNDRALTVRFEPATDGKTTVTLSGNMYQKQIDALQTIKADKGVLDINIPHDSFRLMEINFDLWKSNRQELIVKLGNPDALQLFSIYSSSGSVKVSGAAADKIKIASGSGSMKLEDIKGDTVEIKAGSGSMTLDNLKGNEILIDSDSGSVTGKGITGSSKITADSGSVRLSDMNGPSTVAVGSGSIRFAQAPESADSVTIETDSGSVRVTPSAKFQGSYDLRSDSGSVKAPDSKATSTEVIKVRSDSGSIRIIQ
jgi:DUF4097 and DUF4098 domain-containing protein YvlB